MKEGSACMGVQALWGAYACLRCCGNFLKSLLSYFGQGSSGEFCASWDGSVILCPFSDLQTISCPLLGVSRKPEPLLCGHCLGLETCLILCQLIMTLSVL